MYSVQCHWKSRNSHNKIWDLASLEYAQFDGGVQFFYFNLQRPFLGKFNPSKITRLKWTFSEN